LIDNLRCLQGKLPQHATRNDWYMALAYTVRDRMIDRYINTLETMTDAGGGSKVVAYLSAEFLVGPHLGNGLISLGIWDTAEQALADFALERLNAGCDRRLRQEQRLRRAAERTVVRDLDERF